MHSIVQILKLNEARSGKTVTGREWTIQDAECLLLNDDGTINEVGVLTIPRELNGKATPGTFMGAFALRANKSREGGRRIEAVLTGLQPYSLKSTPVQVAPAKT